MSNIISDFFDFVGSALSDVGHTIEDAAKAILKDPIGMITTAAAISCGIPPVWAAALGSGTDAALHGGNIIKAAVTGGAMAAMGQYAGAAAASGGYGALAQSAATGTAAAVTGAVLTGQDLVTAAKTGLILGTAAGGIQQLMTKQEAISSIPKDTLVKAAASNDPIGTLSKEMGWYDTNSAYDAAQTAWSQNRNSSITGLADTIPESVLKEAYDLPYYEDQTAFIADKMGWDLNGNTMNAAGTAFDDYKAGQAAYNSSTAGQINQIASAAGIDHVDAGVLMDSGYTLTDVKNLVAAGYSGDDLVNLASTDVPAITLKNLANTQFAEHTISNLLENGVSANDIATASANVGRNLITESNATDLLKAGFTGSDLNQPNVYKNPQLAVNSVASGLDAHATAQLMNVNVNTLSNVQAAINSGNLEASAVNNFVKQGGYSPYIFNNPNITDILEMSQNGISTKNINTMISNGWDIAKVNDIMQTGTATANDINTHMNAANYSSWLNNEITASQHSIISDYLQSTGVEAGDANTLAANGFTAGDVEKLTKLGYTTSDLADMAATGVKPATLTTLANTPFSEHSINNMLTSGQVTADEIANTSNLVSAGKISTQSAETLLTKGLTVTQMSNAIYTGKADSMASLLDKGVSANSAMTMYNNGIDLKAANDMIDKGYLNVDKLNTSPSTANTLLKTAQADLTAHDAQVKAQQLADEQAAAKVQAEAQQKALVAQQQADTLKAQQDAITNMNNTMTQNSQTLGGVTKVDTMVDSTGKQTTYVTYGNGATNTFETQAPAGTQPHDWTTTVDNTKPTVQPIQTTENATTPTVPQAVIPPNANEFQPIPIPPETVAQPTPEPVPTQPEVVAQQPVEPTQPTQPTHAGGILNSYTIPMSDGSTQVINYYGDGSVEVLHNEAQIPQPVTPEQPKTVDVSNITQEELNQLTQTNNPYADTGEGTQTAKLSDPSQKIVTDAQNDYLNGKTTFEDAATKVNKAVQDDINSGYLKDNGDGTYTAPDGVIYFMNSETGMFDARVGVANGTGAGGTESQPVVNGPVIVPPTTEPTPVQPPVQETAPVVPPVEQPPIVQPPIVQPPITEPINVTPPTSTPTVPETIPTTPTAETGGGTVAGPINPGTQGTSGGPGGSQDIGTSTTGNAGGTSGGILPGTGQLVPGEHTGSITSPLVEQPPVTTPVVPETPPVEQPPVENPPVDEIPHHDELPPEDTNPEIGVPYVPIPTTDTTPTEDTYRGRYTWGTVKPVNKQTELNPGLINAPTFYKNINPAQAKYYWGQHPFQPTSTFNPTLYNQIPTAPVSPWGSTYAKTAASAQDILNAMRGQYPLLNTVTVNGPVVP